MKHQKFLPGVPDEGPPESDERLSKYTSKWRDCQSCGLCQNRSTEEPVLMGEGNIEADILIIGEAPTSAEMMFSSLPENEPTVFMGASGKLLNQILAATCIDKEVNERYYEYNKFAHTKTREREFHDFMFEWRKSHYYLTNIVGCPAPEDRPPAGPEIKACESRISELIYLMDPRLIVAMGKLAASMVTGISNLPLTSKHGQIFDTEFNGLTTKLIYPVVPVFSTSHLLKKADWSSEYGDTQASFRDWKDIHDVVANINEASPRRTHQE